MKRILLLPLALLASCVSSKVTFATPPVQADEEVVGRAEGSAGGFMLLQLIPIMQNTRFERAYQEALQTSGGTRLVDVTVWESWYWAYIGNGYTFHVAGTAVRKRR